MEDIEHQRIRLMGPSTGLFPQYEGAHYLGSVRPVVAYFSIEMEKKLAKNDHKTDWRTLPIEAHVRKLSIEFEEFKCALAYEGAAAAKTELIDMANYCLILHDRITQAEKNNEEQANARIST